MTILQSGIVWGDTPANVILEPYFNLYPKIEVFIDKATKYGYSEEKKIFRTYDDIYDVSECCSNIKMRSTLKDNCGTLTFKLLHEDCQRLFSNGDRVRLYLDKHCWFCGFIFSMQYAGKNDMQVTVFDFLRYFKNPLMYMKSQLKSQDGTKGLTASEIFKKLCTDLSIPYSVITNATIPVPAQNYDRKTGFNIMEFAINQTLMNSPKEAREYFTFYHETNLDADEGVQNYLDTQLFKTSGEVQFQLRNNLTVDVPITDELLIKYNYETSIDKQTYNEVILYKDQKTYLSKKGKKLKRGKKTGTRIVKSSNNGPNQDKWNLLKGKWGYLPYYHKCPDGYTEAQMQNVANQLQDILGRETHSLQLSCYGIIGLRAGQLVGVGIKDIGGTSVGVTRTNEDGTQDFLPVYRTVQQCEFIIEHPLKMNVTVSSASFGEYDL